MNPLCKGASKKSYPLPQRASETSWLLSVVYYESHHHMQHAIPSLERPLAPISNPTGARGQHQSFQHPCVKALPNTCQGFEWGNLSGVTLLEWGNSTRSWHRPNSIRAHIVDGDDDPQFSYGGCEDVLPDEHCVVRHAT